NVARKPQKSANLVTLLHIIDTLRLLQLLKDEPRAIFTAASKAQAAADWMHAQQP
ncbi:hypothetical protein KXW38_009405, partial [Aspergillus fumigatus]